MNETTILNIDAAAILVDVQFAMRRLGVAQDELTDTKIWTHKPLAIGGCIRHALEALERIKAAVESQIV